MRGRRRFLALLPLAVSLVAAAPSPASSLDVLAAVPQQYRPLVQARLNVKKPRLNTVSRFTIEMRDGYQLTVRAADGIVAVEMARSAPDDEAAAIEQFFKRGAAVTAYVARGTMTSRRIEASFGDLGRVSVRFRPSGRVLKSPRRRRCKGPDRFSARLGVFVGSIRFRSEDGRFDVRAHRAKGRVRSPRQLRCGSSRFSSGPRRYHRPVRQGGGGLRASILDAGWRDGLSGAQLLGFKFGSGTLFFAIAEASMGSMARLQYALGFGPSRALVHTDALTEATLRPPSPFKGTGSYAAAADGARSWTGKLSVAFPGTPRLPLAGPPFRARLMSGF